MKKGGMKDLFKKGRGRLQKKREQEAKEDGAKTAASIRLGADLSNLELPKYCQIDMPNRNDTSLFFISIHVQEGYWKTATVKFKFQIPPRYPFQPPKVTCENKIYHPNINISGAVCLNILRKEWKPVFDIQHIIHGLIFLFLEPNDSDPLNQEAAEVMRKDKRQFGRYVDQSLRGRAVQGESFPKNPTYKS